MVPQVLLLGGYDSFAEGMNGLVTSDDSWEVLIKLSMLIYLLLFLEVVPLHGHHVIFQYAKYIFLPKRTFLIAPEWLGL